MPCHADVETRPDQFGRGAAGDHVRALCQRLLGTAPVGPVGAIVEALKQHGVRVENSPSGAVIVRCPDHTNVTAAGGAHVGLHEILSFQAGEPPRDYSIKVERIYRLPSDPLGLMLVVGTQQGGPHHGEQVKVRGGPDASEYLVVYGPDPLEEMGSTDRR